MRKAIVGLAPVLALVVGVGAAESQVHVGADVDPDGLDYFHMALGDVYGAPMRALPAYMDPDELPVAYLLAREAGVSPEVVIALREQGWSWLDITYHLGVDPYVYVAHLPPGYGYWNRRAVRDYRYLSDRHIIDYVNVVFWAQYHHRPVTQIIVIRQRVPTWTYYVRYYAPPRVVYRTTTRHRYDPPPARREARRRTEPTATPTRRAVPRTGIPATTSRPTQTTRPIPYVSPPTGSRGTEAQTRRPAQATPRPTQATQRPTQRPPAQATQRPTTGPRPTQASQRPITSSPRPSQASQRPRAGSPRPSQATRRPARRPAATSQRPARASQRPARSGARPSARPSGNRRGG